MGCGYQAKIDDLARQYTMRATVEWVQTLELAMPVQRFEVQIRQRKAPASDPSRLEPTRAAARSHLGANAAGLSNAPGWYATR